jgi:hypothetical protein
MSVIGSNILAGASGQGGYFLTNSLRFRSSASAYLSRTPASASNRKTFTWSGWLKLSVSSADLGVISSYSDNNNRSDLRFGNGNSSISFYNIVGGSVTTNLTTTQVFRDPSSWYHIVLAVDTTQATASNRVKLYVNGSQITSFSTATYPSQNNDFFFNSNVSQYVGATGYSPVSNFFDGYMAEVNFVDGQALTPSSFGQTSATTGVWTPKKYTGTYGTNGFYLPFTNTASTSTLGNDFSGNSNTWTVNNISLTAGSTYDSMTDVPTLTSATAANYAVFNPLQIITTGQVTVTNGNLTAANTSGGDSNIRGTMFVSTGKWYAELTITTAGSNYPTVGIIEATEQNLTYLGATAKSYCYTGGGSKGNNNSFTSYGASYTTGDVIGVAYDADNATLTFYKNGTSQGTAYSSVTAGSYTFACSTLTGTININFGQRPFTYTPPTGFVGLNTFNLPTPTIGATASTTANKYFNIVTYTGASTGVSVDVGFNPDFTWMKNRSNAYDHWLYDTNRTYSNQLISNSAAAAGSSPLTRITNGFLTDPTTGSQGLNGQTYVAWNWYANGATTVTNTQGSINSTVQANTTAGFSIVTFTAPSGSTAYTVGHGLGTTPAMIIVKERGASGNDWYVWHQSYSNTAQGNQRLNTTAAVGNSSQIWNNTAPTSTVFSSISGTAVSSSTTAVAYCFAQVAGYSAFGSYTGNASSDGPFVYTGFRPKFVLYKNSSSGSAFWRIWDSSRSPNNEVNAALFPNASNAEDVGGAGPLDFVSNGFKIRTSQTNDNGSGNTFIYMAFAETPLKFSNAR